MTRTTLFIMLISVIFINTSFAEKIELKSGQIIDVEVVEKADQYIKVDSGIGIYTTYYLDEIENVTENNSLDEPIIETNDDKNIEIRKEFYPNGSVHYERGYKNGEKHGLAKEYDISGNVIRAVTYVNGKMHGEFRTYYPSGKLKDLKIYVDGLIEGVSKQYNEGGKLTAELTRDRGEMTWWKTKSYDYYPNGKLKYEYLYNQKISEGYRKDFHDNGQLSLEFNIKGGQFLGCKNYDEDGNFLSDDCPEQ